MKCQAHARMSRARASHQTKAKFERMFCPKAAPTTVPEREALIRKLSPEGCMTLARETFGREPSSSDVAFVKSAVRDLFCLVFFSLLCTHLVFMYYSSRAGNKSSHCVSSLRSPRW